MAYAALISLSQTLGQTIMVCGLSLEKEKLVSLQGSVSSILSFIESHPNVEELDVLESRIIDAAYRAEDAIDSKISDESFPSNTIVQRQEEVHEALRDLNFILEMAMSKIKNHGTAENVQISTRPASVSLTTLSLNDTSTMVGFHDDILAIKNRMYHQHSPEHIIPIVGMGGIGKSTLARALYDDAIRTRYFDRYAWIVVSQEYSLKDILLGLLNSFNIRTDKLYTRSDDELLVRAHKELYRRRYLIVLDDVWSTDVCDQLIRIFPQCYNGSRVLLTTRLLDVANYSVRSSGQPHNMRFLSEQESWSLLEKWVFEGESCPLSLVPVAKKIAESSQGLPLTIVVVAGLLKLNITSRYWESISREVGSRESTIASICSKVMSLSYDRLSIYLRPCFLYTTAFAEDHDISAKQLIRLWVAEAFIKPSESKCLEEVAEGYLEDLVGRSLLLVSKRRYNGRIKSVKIHDVLRDMGISKAKQERFHYGGLLERMEGKHRRFSIHNRASMDFLQNIHDKTTRSVLIFFNGYITNSNPVLNLRLLRVLDALNAHLIFDFGTLIHLRHLALKYDEPELPVSVFRLQNLQTLIIRGVKSREETDGLRVSLEIWKMLSLRHLILPEQSHLDQPPEDEMVEETNLQTLSLATNLEMTTQITTMLVNLRKLGLFYFGMGEQEWNKFQFSNLSQLPNLEELKIIFEKGGRWWPDLLSAKLAFPLSLKKLTLENIHRPWEDMNIVGELPNLEVLKLRRMACIGKEWNPLEGQFQKLKYLKLEQVYLKRWNADSVCFPSLEVLVLELMGNLQAPLKKIPADLADIDTLELIQLRTCTPAIVESAMQIQTEQRRWGNDDLQLLIFN